MAQRCAKCGNKAREDRHSPLGERVCERCYMKTNGAVIGGLAAGLPGAVTGPGILDWVRRSLKPDRTARAETTSKSSTTVEQSDTPA